MAQIDEKTVDEKQPLPAVTQLPPPPPPPVATDPPPTFPQAVAPQQPGAQIPPLAPATGQQYRDELYARCAHGLHDPSTKFGVCGILTAIFCFPIGLICLFADTERRCSRCGVRMVA